MDNNKVICMEKTENIIAVKSARVAIDGVIQQVKSLPISREQSLSVTKLQEGVMWLGMELKRLGEQTPYPNSRDITNAVVDPTAQGMKL